MENIVESFKNNYYLMEVNHVILYLKHPCMQSLRFDNKSSVNELFDYIKAHKVKVLTELPSIKNPVNVFNYLKICKKIKRLDVGMDEKDIRDFIETFKGIEEYAKSQDNK